MAKPLLWQRVKATDVILRKIPEGMKNLNPECSPE
jgi:hypothetical protein